MNKLLLMIACLSLTACDDLSMDDFANALADYPEHSRNSPYNSSYNSGYGSSRPRTVTVNNYDSAIDGPLPSTGGRGSSSSGVQLSSTQVESNQTYDNTRCQYGVIDSKGICRSRPVESKPVWQNDTPACNMSAEDRARGVACTVGR